MFKINHEEAKSVFEVVAPGEYEVTVTNYEMKTAASGKNMVVVEYEIRSDVNQPHQGQKIMYDNFVVSDNTMWRFQAISKAARFPDGLEFANYKEWAETLFGKTLVLVVGNREYNGKVFPEVKNFKESALDAPGKVTVTDDDVPF